MSALPVFPTFTPIALEHKDAIDAALRLAPPLASEYTFTNLFAWGEVSHYAVSQRGAHVLVRKGAGRELTMLQPLGPDADAATLEAMLAYLAPLSDCPAIERVGEDFLARLDCPHHLRARDERAQFDYVYAVDEMIALTGEKFHAKKNLLNQFQKRYAYRYLPLTTGEIARTLPFHHAWCAERECEKNEGMRREQCAVFRMLEHFEYLGLAGGAIEIDGEIVALTLGERLNADTLVIHVEKARAGYIGLYQAINWEFLRHAAQDYRFVNREQDLGVEGLRKAKLSYNPVRMVKKYRVTERG